MSTSGGGSLNAIAYLVVIGMAVWSVLPVLGEPPRWLGRPRPAAVVLWLVVAVPSLLEFAVPEIFTMLSRQPARIEQGQVWRLITSVTVQDGGWFGTVFNLVILAVVAAAAVPVWGAVRSVAVFVLGGFGFDLLATFAWGEAGGGNSAATFALAGSVVAVLAVRRRTRRHLVAAAVVVLVGVVLVGVGLVVLDDAHSIAVLGGVAIGALGAVTVDAVPVSRRRAAAG